MTLTADRALDVVDAAMRYAVQQLAKATLPATILERDATIALLGPGFAADLVEYFDGVLARAGVAKDLDFPLDPDRIDWVVEARLLGEVLEEIYVDLGTLAYGHVGDQLGLELSLSLEGPATAPIRDRLATQVTQITGTLQETLRDKVETAIARGLSIEQLVAGTSDMTGLRDLFGSRARMIALTETATAYNTAAIAGYASSGIVDTVEVFDGADCGWTSHDDPDLAHGSVRTLRAANAQPVSHPNCQRAFGAVVAR